MDSIVYSPTGLIHLVVTIAAELLTRIPESLFQAMIGYASGGIMLVGGVVFGQKKKAWGRLFSKDISSK